MKKTILLLLLCLPFLSIAQGIKFEEGLTWRQVLAKAKAENKYIFVDCYATWCGPCKMMDEEIYPLKEVGDIYNGQFVSVKVQMDKTDKDDSLVKNWYIDAARLLSTYTVSSFPTFLFFSPDGKPVHKVAATKSVEGFIELAKNAKDPDRQYYRVLQDFQPGKLDIADLKGLANSFRYSDTGLAGMIALDYLNRIPKSELSAENNLGFMRRFPKSQLIMSKVIEYIKNLDKQEVLIKKNLDLLWSFKEHKLIQDFVIQYLENLDKEKKEDDGIDLMIAFKEFDKVKEIAGEYVRRLQEAKLSAPDNVKLVLQFGDYPKIEEVVNKYIKHLPEASLYTKDHINLISSFTKKSSDLGFDLFYHHGKQIDEVMAQKGFAKRNADRIIIQEEITPILAKAKNEKTIPNWEEIEKGIKNKYGKIYSYKNVANAKPGFYMSLKDTALYGKYLTEFVDKYVFRDAKKFGGEGVMFYLNQVAFRIFEIDTNKKDLQKALAWSEFATKDSLNDQYQSYIDTKATILYKLNYLYRVGSREYAIAIEEKTPFIKTLEKMKKGLPIW